MKASFRPECRARRVAVAVVVQKGVLAVLVRYPDRLAEFVVGSLMGVAFGVDRDLQLLKAVVLAAGNSPLASTIL